MDTKHGKRTDFFVDAEKCIACGKCVNDCPAGVIEIVDKLAVKNERFDDDCIGCQHCLAICPTAAAHVLGLDPKNSKGILPHDPVMLDNLFRSRRSIRKFSAEPVDKNILQEVLDSVANSPTGVNARYRRFTIIHDPAVLAEFRDRACRTFIEKASQLPEELSWLTSAAEKYLEKGRDVIFRGAPHLIVVTASQWQSTPETDCVIALTHFDLMAQARGIGTVWVGMVQYLLEFIPETRTWLGIPEDHTLGYAMLFGMPEVRYARTVQHRPEEVVVLDKLA